MTARPYARILEDGSVLIACVKATYIIRPSEIVMLLPSCRSLWILAARRGKAHRRAEDAARRATRCGAQGATS